MSTIFNGVKLKFLKLLIILISCILENYNMLKNINSKYKIRTQKIKNTIYVYEDKPYWNSEKNKQDIKEITLAKLVVLVNL